MATQNGGGRTAKQSFFRPTTTTKGNYYPYILSRCVVVYSHEHICQNCLQEKKSRHDIDPCPGFRPSGFPWAGTERVWSTTPSFLPYTTKLLEPQSGGEARVVHWPDRTSVTFSFPSAVVAFPDSSLMSSFQDVFAPGVWVDNKTKQHKFPIAGLLVRTTALGMSRHPDLITVVSSSLSSCLSSQNCTLS